MGFLFRKGFLAYVMGSGDFSDAKIFACGVGVRFEFELELKIFVTCGVGFVLALKIFVAGVLPKGKIDLL